MSRERSRESGNVCAVLRKSTCATRNPGQVAKLFLAPQRSLEASSRHRMRACMIGERCRVACTPRESKPQKTSVFLFSWNAIAHIGRIHCASRAATRGIAEETQGSSRRKKDCVRLLTVEKTVIRFRPSSHTLRPRVSIKIATTRSTTRTSARTIDMVEVSLSSAKTFSLKCSSAKSPLIPFITKPAAQAPRVFCCPGLRAGHAESVPVRPARRRLIAGPTPAVLLRTGQF